MIEWHLSCFGRCFVLRAFAAYRPRLKPVWRFNVRLAIAWSAKKPGDEVRACDRQFLLCTFRSTGLDLTNFRREANVSSDYRKELRWDGQDRAD
nr:hypothetical protein [uncultured Dyadobacter sp.]